MIINANSAFSYITQRVKALQGKLHNCDGVWLRCNYLKENNHFVQLRLAVNHHSGTLYPVQLRIPG